MRAASALLLALPILAACSTANVGQRLAPRAAELIDPRVEVVNAAADASADPTLLARLATLRQEARAGDAAFEPRLAEARRLAAATGPAESESWVAAQQALSAAVAAKGPTARALGEINALAAARIAPDSIVGRGDFEAIQAALAEVGAIDLRQSRAVEAVEAELRR